MTSYLISTYLVLESGESVFFTASVQVFIFSKVTGLPHAILVGKGQFVFYWSYAAFVVGLLGIYL